MTFEKTPVVKETALLANLAARIDLKRDIAESPEYS